MLIEVDEIEIMGSKPMVGKNKSQDYKQFANKRVLPQDLLNGTKRWLQHDLLSGQGIKKSTNKTLVKVLFEAVTQVREWPAQSKGLTNEQIMSAACSIECARLYDEEHLLQAARRAL